MMEMFSEKVVLTAETRGGHSHMHRINSQDWGQEILTVTFTV